MKYSLEFNGIQQKAMEKFDCFDAIHEIGSHVKGEAYSLSYDVINKATELTMEHEGFIASCKLFIGTGL